jgi:hypothetical protein
MPSSAALRDKSFTSARDGPAADEKEAVEPLAASRIKFDARARIDAALFETPAPCAS